MSGSPRFRMTGWRIFLASAFAVIISMALGLYYLIPDSCILNQKINPHVAQVQPFQLNTWSNFWTVRIVSLDETVPMGPPQDVVIAVSKNPDMSDSTILDLSKDKEEEGKDILVTLWWGDLNTDHYYMTIRFLHPEKWPESVQATVYWGGI